jgi:hypothetical protein
MGQSTSTCVNPHEVRQRGACSTKWGMGITFSGGSLHWQVASDAHLACSTSTNAVWILPLLAAILPS